MILNIILFSSVRKMLIEITFLKYNIHTIIMYFKLQKITDHVLDIKFSSELHSVWVCGICNISEKEGNKTGKTQTTKTLPVFSF